MSKWALARIRDDVRVSGYGNGPIHEDQAGFARLYAILRSPCPSGYGADGPRGCWPLPLSAMRPSPTCSPLTKALP